MFVFDHNCTFEFGSVRRVRSSNVGYVATLERYFERTALDRSSTDFVFRGIVHTKAGERLRKVGGISYS